MSWQDTQIRETLLAINVAGAVNHEFYFPKKARIKRYFAVPAVAQAAHSTIVVDVSFQNAALDGSGSTVLALLTNDSDDADDLTTEVGAWVAHDAKELNTEDRPGTPGNTDNVADEIAAGSVIKAVVTGAGSTPTANWLAVGIEFVWSD